ncbi:GNAT family N-acetyltransferase [Xanthobacter sp. TB0136]|uniref:GNAT family N-acetyltransferase n=1 Tax=Xanthobacter sp. TB0136 TaxID=3459177 RepID=UPI004039818D
MPLIRQAALEDLEALVPLLDAYRQFYGQPGDLAGARAFLKARFEHGQSVLFLAEEKGETVGFTQLFPTFSSVLMRRVFVLNDLFVAPQARRTGTGRALLEAAARHARTLGAARLSLITAVDNLPGQALYESCGWVREQKFFTYHLHLDN